MIVINRQMSKPRRVIKKERKRQLSTQRRKRPTRAQPETHDDYFAMLSADKRAALQKLRRTIKAAAPGAKECISYGIPAFRLDGKLLVFYGAGKNHCAFYPGSTLQALDVDLTKYDTSKGTIRFSSDKPLPAVLVRKLVKLRIAERG